MDWTEKMNSQALDWLLEEDASQPSVRYLTLKQLCGMPEKDSDVRMAFERTLESGPIPAILAEQHPEGYWQEAGPGYLPKYSSTIWQIILLGQLGASISTEEVKKACDYILETARTKLGEISMAGNDSGRIHCLQGNISAALMDMGVMGDERLDQALELMACSVTGDDYQGNPYRYLRSGISGPGLECSANEWQLCAWGAVKVALALAKVPEKKVTPIIKKARRICIDKLLSTDPAGADYPHPSYAKKTSTSWFKFGFPVFYVTDVLQILEALLALGLAGDSRLKNAIELVEGKQDDAGRWIMEYTYNGKMSVEIEEKKKPSKWVTLRALRVLKDYYSN
jgi:hypothetical protein